MKYLVFTADWCRPCKELKQSIELLQKMTGSIDLEYIDIAAAPDLVERYAIRSVPTIIKLETNTHVLHSVGKLDETLEHIVEVARVVGQQDFHDLNLFFNSEEKV